MIKILACILGVLAPHFAHAMLHKVPISHPSLGNLLGEMAHPCDISKAGDEAITDLSSIQGLASDLWNKLILKAPVSQPIFQPANMGQKLALALAEIKNEINSINNVMENGSICINDSAIRTEETKNIWLKIEGFILHHLCQNQTLRLRLGDLDKLDIKVAKFSGRHCRWEGGKGGREPHLRGLVKFIRKTLDEIAEGGN